MPRPPPHIYSCFIVNQLKESIDCTVYYNGRPGEEHDNETVKTSIEPNITFILVSIFVVAASRKLRTHINVKTLSPSAITSTKTQKSGWSDTGSMNVPRTDLVSGFLPNGKVLVTGGIFYDGVRSSTELNDGVVLDSTELYDPSSGNWTISGTMHFPRTQHAVSVLPNGKVLATGGVANGEPVIQTAELYDPSIGNWTTVYNMPDCRSGHTSTVLPNGKVLVVGGYCNPNYKNSADLYDPSTEMWTTTGSLHYQRRGHTTSVLSNGKVLVTGGMIEDTIFTDTAELYDPSTGNWTISGKMHYARNEHTASVLSNGKVLVTGGDLHSSTVYSAELYDPSTEIWTITGKPSTRRSFHTASILLNGKVLITGGMIDIIVPINITELYDPSTENWTTVGYMHFQRTNHIAAVLTNGNVLVTGGFCLEDDQIVLSQSELYNSSTQTWISMNK